MDTKISGPGHEGNAMREFGGMGTGWGKDGEGRGRDMPNKEMGQEGDMNGTGVGRECNIPNTGLGGDRVGRGNGTWMERFEERTDADMNETGKGRRGTMRGWDRKEIGIGASRHSYGQFRTDSFRRSIKIMLSHMQTHTYKQGQK